jgi:hypothetical protein
MTLALWARHLGTQGRTGPLTNLSPHLPVVQRPQSYTVPQPAIQKPWSSVKPRHRHGTAVADPVGTEWQYNPQTAPWPGMPEPSYERATRVVLLRVLMRMEPRRWGPRENDTCLGRSHSVKTLTTMLANAAQRISTSPHALDLTTLSAQNWVRFVGTSNSWKSSEAGADGTIGKRGHNGQNLGLRM